MIARDVLVAGSAAMGLAALGYLALGWDRRRRWAAVVALEAAILLCPLLAPARPPVARFLAGILAIAAAVKLHDLHVGADLGSRPEWWRFAASLPNVALIVLRKAGAEPRPNRRRDLAVLARNGLGAVVGAVVLVAVFRVDWRRHPFALEHAAKVLAFFGMLVPATVAGVAALRLLGAPARTPMDNPFAARTPADYWRRHNRPAAQFFHEDVFKPAGGRRRPVLATLLAFAVSGVVHEYLFAIAIGAVQGYQMAFFLIQGVAVVATRGVRPRGGWAALGVVATLAFNLATGALFFASLGQVVPFYAARTGG